MRTETLWQLKRVNVCSACFPVVDREPTATAQSDLEICISRRENIIDNFLSLFPSSTLLSLCVSIYTPSFPAVVSVQGLLRTPARLTTTVSEFPCHITSASYEVPVFNDPTTKIWIRSFGMSPCEAAGLLLRCRLGFWKIWSRMEKLAFPVELRESLEGLPGMLRESEGEEDRCIIEQRQLLDQSDFY